MIPTDETQVVEVAQRFMDCWNAHDMSAFAELFAPDADFVNVIGMRWIGRAAIRAAHEASHAGMFRTSHLAIHRTTPRMLSPSAGVIRSQWTLTGHTTPSGQPLAQRSGYLTHVLQKQAGGWLIVVSQNTDIVPAL